MKSRRMIILLLLSFLIITCTYVFQLGGDNNELITNLLYLVPPFVATVAGIYATKMYGINNPHGSSLAYLTAGVFGFFLGEATWFALIFIYNVDPFPSIADVFFLAGYPLLFIGIVKEFLLHKSALRDFNKLLLLFISLISAALIFVFLYFGYQAYDPEVTLATNAIALGYNLGDVLLIIPCLVVLKMALSFKGGKLFYSWSLFLMGLLLLMVGDILFSLYYEGYEEVLYPYTLIDLAWVSMYLFFTYSFYHTGDAIRQIQAKLIKK